MMTKLEVLENKAKLIGSAFYNFTPHDRIEVFHQPDWVGDGFEYRFNGVNYEREYIADKIPGYFEDENDVT